MPIQFVKAVKYQSKLRLALSGPAGSGKTWTALTFAGALGGKIAVVDTEHGSARKYSDLFSFDVIELDSFNPETLIEAIHAAETAGYDVLVVDSLSHFWYGPGGLLEIVDDITKRSKSGNSYTAWKDATPIQNKLIDAIIASKLHIIATMRAKTKYVLEEREGGKMSPKKMGMEPIQREGIEFEFDIEAEMDTDNTMVVGKTRCSAVNGKVIRKPTAAFITEFVLPWLEGKAPPEQVPEKKQEPAQKHEQKPEPGKLSQAKRDEAVAKIKTMMERINRASFGERYTVKKIPEVLMFKYGQESPEALSDADLLDLGKSLAEELKEVEAS